MEIIIDEISDDLITDIRIGQKLCVIGTPVLDGTKNILFLEVIIEVGKLNSIFESRYNLK